MPTPLSSGGLSPLSVCPAKLQHRFQYRRRKAVQFDVRLDFCDDGWRAGAFLKSTLSVLTSPRPGRSPFPKRFYGSLTRDRLGDDPGDEMNYGVNS